MQTAFFADRCAAASPLMPLVLALLLAGCATDRPPAKVEPPIDSKTGPAAVPAAAIQERLENDEGAWVIPWLLTRWQLQAPTNAILKAFAKYCATGYSAEEALLAVLPQAGLWTYAQFGSWGDLHRQISNGCPVLVQLTTSSGRRRVRQFLFVTELHRAGNRVAGELAGGAVYDREVDEFLLRWKTTHFWMLTACPPERAQWKMRTPERMSLMRHYEQIGQPAQADLEANRALVTDPSNPDVLNGLGVRALKRGEIDEAERFFRRAISIDDRHVQSLNNLAFLLVENGRSIEEAGALARRAVLLEPTNPRALDTYALVLMKQQRWADARTLLERAWSRARGLPLDARIEIGLRLGRAYVRLGEQSLACQMAKDLRALDAALALPEELHRACLNP